MHMRKDTYISMINQFWTLKHILILLKALVTDGETKQNIVWPEGQSAFT